MRFDSEDGRLPPAPRAPRQPRPWLQVLNGVLWLAGKEAQLLRHCETPWASATFSGMRHSVQLLFKDEAGAQAAEHFVEQFGEHEFNIPGKLVADASILAVEQVMQPHRRITIEAELLVLDHS